MPVTEKRAGFTEVETAAMKARADELRSSGRGGATKAEEAQACLDAIPTMIETFVRRAVGPAA